MWPQVGKIEILKKHLSPTAQNHNADLEDTCDSHQGWCHCKIHQKKLSKKNKGWGQIWPRVAVWGLSPFLPVFWEHTGDLQLLLGDAAHEWLVVSLFSSLVFAVLLGAS